MKIAFMADSHLGCRQYGITERAKDFLRAFKNACQSVIDQKIPVLILGGDLFESPKPDPEAVMTVQDCVDRLKAAGTRVLGIDGNHDLADGNWLRVCGVFPMDVDENKVMIDGVRIRGISFRKGPEVLTTLQNMVNYGDKADIVVLHLALAEMNAGGNADVCTAELNPLLKKLGTKLVLMGHIHIKDVRDFDGIRYAYPGSTEMKASNEPKDKYFLVVDTETREITACPVKTRPTREVEIQDETQLANFLGEIHDPCATYSVMSPDQVFYTVFANSDIPDVYSRLAVAVKENNAMARIILQNPHSSDVIQKVDRSNGMETLEGAIEAFFDAGSPEAGLVKELLASPQAVGRIVDKFMEK